MTTLKMMAEALLIVSYTAFTLPFERLEMELTPTKSPFRLSRETRRNEEMTTWFHVVKS